MRGFTDRSTSLALFCAALGLAVLTGCGAHVPAPPPVGLASGLPRVAILPLENLTPRGDASDRLTRVLAGVLGETRQCQPVQPGDVDQVFMELRIRDVNGVTRERVPEVAQRLDARWLLAGTILEYGEVRSSEGAVPTVGITLRLLDGRNGRTAWSAMRVMTGEDHETLFGLGRVRSVDLLSEKLVRQLLGGFKLPADGDTLMARGAKR